MVARFVRDEEVAGSNPVTPTSWFDDDGSMGSRATRLRGAAGGSERIPPKTTPPGDLVAAIHAVHSGDLFFAPTVTRRLVEAYVRRPPSGSLPEVVASLTERELDVLRSMAKGLSNAEIGRELFLGEATVKTHVTRILAKLGLRDRVQAVVLAYESGLV